jgi:iron(III) transport system substrate-binding protein
MISKLSGFILHLSSFILLALLAAGCQRTQPRVVLYCAQDKEFAEPILAKFTGQTGLEVSPKYDTEATKSVSLAVELEQEQARPRCDVFWNNEILSTIRLQRRHLLEPYESPAAQVYPASSKAKDHTWQAFAARARVLLVNTQHVPSTEYPRSIFDLTQPRWKGKVGMAKPQFGTTATQAACLFEVLGPEKAKQFYRDLRANEVQVVSGNKQAAEGASQGQFLVGMTDTDDALEEIRDGKPVAMIFPDRDAPPDGRMGTLFIPNTVAVIRGGPNPAGARQLVDFLLSPETETRLAEQGAYQIPLNPNVKATLHPEMRNLKHVKRMDVDFEKAADLWEGVQEFLTKAFSRP